MIAGRLRRAIVGQFGRPTGLLGRLAGWIMERRPSNRERNRRTLDALDIQPGERVLEIGFGPGLAIEWAARRAGHVVGIDHSEVMLERASKRNASAIARGLVELHLASVAALPPLGSAFDKAFAVNVYMFWRDPVGALRRLAEVLRPGATLALTHQPRQARATDEDALRAGERIAADLRAAGFEDVRSEVFRMKPVHAVCVVGRKPAAGSR